MFLIQQVFEKYYHIRQKLISLDADIEKLERFSQAQQLKVSISIVELLLEHKNTEFYHNVMLQGRKPYVLALNRGLVNYTIPNHVATFERKPGLYHLFIVL